MKRLLVILLVTAFGFGLPGCDAPSETKSAEKARPSAMQSKSKPIDINRASAEELMALKGIGEARAKAIIKGRPYARKDELVHQKIVPQSVYEEIREQIVARQ